MRECKKENVLRINAISVYNIYDNGHSKRTPAPWINKLKFLVDPFLVYHTYNLSFSEP